MRTITALFDSAEHAQASADALRRAGVDAGDIRLAPKDPPGSNAGWTARVVLSARVSDDGESLVRAILSNSRGVNAAGRDTNTTSTHSGLGESVAPLEPEPMASTFSSSPPV